MRRALFLGWALMFLLAAAVNAIPQEINFQGILKDSAGVNVEGTVDITFAIYAAASGGTALWSETQSGVSVEAGLYNVRLGSGTPLPHSVFADGSTRYLGIKVGSDVEMTPRLPMISVPFAFRAASAEAAVDSQTLGGYAVGTSGNNIIPRTDGSGLLDPSVIPSSGPTNADTVDGFHASSEAAANTILALDPNGIFSLLSSASRAISAESSAAGGTAIRGRASGTGPNYGVQGVSNANNGYGVWGRNEAYGISVYGKGNAAIATGVMGESITGAGVLGKTSSGRGVSGEASTGSGIYGVATNSGGTGVYAENTSATGNGLYVNGKLAVRTGENAIAGVSELPTGAGAQAIITTTAVTGNSLIFLTVGHAATPETGAALALKVHALNEGVSFTVRDVNNNNTTGSPIPFAWLIIN